MRLFAFLLLLAVAAARLSGQQEPLPNGDIIRAALLYIQESRTYNPDGTVMKVDPRVFAPSMGIVPNLSINAARHDPQTLLKLTKMGAAEVVSIETALRCGSNASADCMSNGVSVVLSFGTPQPKGDSLVVDVPMRTSVFVPAGTTRTSPRNGGTVAIVVLAKVDGKWVAVRFRPTAQT